MIITRSPLRLTLGGGGTDLPSYYSRFGGTVVATALNRYVYILVNRMFEDKIRLGYSRTEIVDLAEQLQHPVAREALKLLGLARNLEVVSVADLPSNTGLGSSGSFAVGLLNALHLYKNEMVGPEQLAAEACKIQMEILKEPEGKQDPYVSSFGRGICMEIGRNGAVRVEQLSLRDEVVRELQQSLLFFYTGIRRSSSIVLKEQQEAVRREDHNALEAMHSIKRIASEVRSALEGGDIEEFGRLQHEHWLAKRRTTKAISADVIDRWYEKGIRAGAIGGKLAGAGGGGFIMFCCTDSQNAVRKAMSGEGLREVDFLLMAEGSKVVVNI